jgi:hypothetical protein
MTSQELDRALARLGMRSGRQVMRGTGIILVGVLVFGPAVACAEPLFFDCKGTSHTSAENQDPSRADIDTSIQFMIDESKGVADGAFMLNRYCSHESDWLPADMPEVSIKIIKECTSLEFSAVKFSFKGVFESQGIHVPTGRQVGHYKGITSGSLNRITGELSVENRPTPSIILSRRLCRRIK